MEGGYVLEVPSSLKQLARLVARGFYSIEDALIIDMLVRNPCMKEDDICDLLKFERKMLRARIATLKSDKFLQVKLKMETVDNKTQKVNYYYINYKSFVNVVKYKLDHMRKRMETEERDATSRASFKCPNCKRSFTDLEADQLYDPIADEFRCYMCHSVVEEDQSALPKKDSRQLMARFNEQMEAFYLLLREVEDVKLAPSLLEPEPTDISHLQRDADGRPRVKPGEQQWSGEASRSGGLRVEEARVDVTIGDNAAVQTGDTRKERPIWMVESTVITGAPNEEVTEDILPGTSSLDQITASQNPEKSRGQDDITSMLLAHEKQSTSKPVNPADSSDDEVASSRLEAAVAPVVTTVLASKSDYDDVELLESDEDDQPMVTIGDSKIPLSDVVANPQLINKMTPAEKDAYIQLYQEYYQYD